MPDEARGIGDNLPPDQIEQLSTLLEEATKESAAKVEEFEAAVKRIPEELPDDETAQKVTAVIGQMGSWEKEIESQRKARKKPYDDLGKAVQSHFKPILDTLKAAKAVATGKLSAYQRKQAEAARAEEERLRREADEKAAEAAATGSIEAQQDAANAQAKADRVIEDAGKVTTDYGQTATMRKTWQVEITDIKAFIQAVAKGDLPLEWIEVNESAIKKAAVDKTVDAETSIPGVRLWQDEKAIVRS